MKNSTGYAIYRVKEKNEEINGLRVTLNTQLTENAKINGDSVSRKNQVSLIMLGSTMEETYILYGIEHPVFFYERSMACMRFEFYWFKIFYRVMLANGIF